MSLYPSVNELSKNTEAVRVSVNKKAKEVLKMYIGVGKKAKLFYCLNNSDINTGITSLYSDCTYNTNLLKEFKVCTDYYASLGNETIVHSENSDGLTFHIINNGAGNVIFHSTTQGTFSDYDKLGMKITYNGESCTEDGSCKFFVGYFTSNYQNASGEWYTLSSLESNKTIYLNKTNPDNSDYKYFGIMFTLTSDVVDPIMLVIHSIWLEKNS